MSHLTLAFVTICFIILNGVTHSAKILGVFPVPSLSHQSVFRAYTNELARRGHELVITTPNPALPNDKKLNNITEIDVSISYKDLLEMDRSRMTYGVVMGLDTLYKTMLKVVVEVSHRQLQLAQIKAVLENNNYFDLVILEATLDYNLLVTKFIDAPVILISSYFGTTENYQGIGAPAKHPMLYPDGYRESFGNGIWDKLRGIYEELSLMSVSRWLEDMQNELLKSYFGSEAPTIKNLIENVDLLFVNSHPIFAGNRPVPPSVIFLGALHLQNVKELPKDIKAFLDNSKRGVVYVSFGTNVPIPMMAQALKDIFLNAFGSLNYDVIWKFEGEKPADVPKNLWLHPWLPQRDLLTHPNIKAFVTQGGRQSLDEAIDAGVPMVGIPFLGDQPLNVHRLFELGMGIKIDPLSLTADELAAAVNKVIDDKSYRKNVEKIRTIINDEPQTPMERAIWWTEHILRHKGGRHLRCPGANITWSEYLMLDVFVPLFFVFFGAIVGTVTGLYVIIKKLRSYLRSIKLKTN